MNGEFSKCLSKLRQEKGVSQRVAAKDLGISQALLSHYENGIREPGLGFVVRACDYYGVSADYLLARTEIRELSSGTLGSDISAYGGKDMENLWRAGSIVLDMLRKTGGQQLSAYAAGCWELSIFKIFNCLCESYGTDIADLFNEMLELTPGAISNCGADAASKIEEFMLLSAMNGSGRSPYLPEISIEVLKNLYADNSEPLIQLLRKSAQRIKRL